MASAGVTRKSMTGRYTRQAVPLEVRGVSQEEDLPTRPLPEKADELVPVNYPFYHYPEESYVESTFSQSNPTVSGELSPGDTEGSQSSKSNQWTAGGNTTERSSIFSLGEDEFDRQASRQVRHLFEEIDSMLFESQSGPGHHLHSETQEWVSRFPHVRILGKQVVPPQDLGFQFVSQTPRPESANLLVDITEQDISQSHTIYDLSISGQHVEAQKPAVEIRLPSQSVNNSIYPYETEEVFAHDGVVEDIIAVDYKDESDQGVSGGQCTGQDTQRRKVSGMPPITPQACIKDNIGNNTFDFIWSEVIAWMREPVTQYSDVIISLADFDDDEKIPLKMALPTEAMPPFRERSLLNYNQVPDKNHIPRVSTAQSSQPQDGKSGLALSGVLQISAKTLINREKSGLQEEDLLMEMRFPRDSLVNQSMNLSRYNINPRPFSVKGTERLTSARRGGRGRGGLLAPLERGVKTPNLGGDSQNITKVMVRGERMTTGMSDSPTLSFTRSPALPPISLDVREDSNVTKDHLNEGDQEN